MFVVCLGLDLKLNIIVEKRLSCVLCFQSQCACLLIRVVGLLIVGVSILVFHFGMSLWYVTLIICIAMHWFVINPCMTYQHMPSDKPLLDMKLTNKM